MSAKNLMDGMATYIDVEELAASSVAAQEQLAATISIVISVLTIATSNTATIPAL